MCWAFGVQTYAYFFGNPAITRRPMSRSARSMDNLTGVRAPRSAIAGVLPHSTSCAPIVFFVVGGTEALFRYLCCGAALAT